MMCEKFTDKDSKIIKLCHGSSIVYREIPEQNIYGETNDYGSGFYCTLEKDIELAREWSCSPYRPLIAYDGGVVNKYTLDTEGLKVINLDKLDIIHWIALTAKYRMINGDKDILEKVIDKYSIDISQYDCIYGFRCDDTYSNIVKGFLDGAFTAEAIREAIKLGYLQYEYVIISQEALKKVQSIGYEIVDNVRKYRNRFNKRRDNLISNINNCAKLYRDGKYVYDYIE